MNIELYKCPACGANIDLLNERCNYCGARYKINAYKQLNGIDSGIVAKIAALVSLFVAGVLLLKKIIPLPFAILVMAGFYLLLFVVFINKLAVFAIRLYQYFAPMKIRERCVFTPTCSSYAIQAIKKYGVIKALPMIRNRLKRCHGDFKRDPIE